MELTDDTPIDNLYVIDDLETFLTRVELPENQQSDPSHARNKVPRHVYNDLCKRENWYTRLQTKLQKPDLSPKESKRIRQTISTIEKKFNQYFIPGERLKVAMIVEAIADK